MNNAYTVTAQGCDCGDFESRHIDDQTPCKHQWATLGATAAKLVGELRKARTIPRLEAAGRRFQQAMESCPALFVALARTEYRKCLELLREDQAAIQILIKPQPKSNGTYNGIEI